MCIPETIISSERPREKATLPFLIPLSSGRRRRRILSPTLPISLTALNKGRGSLSPPLPCSPISRRLTKEVAAGLGGGGESRQRGTPPPVSFCPSAYRSPTEAFVCRPEAGITGASPGRRLCLAGRNGKQRTGRWWGKTPPHCHRLNLWPGHALIDHVTLLPYDPWTRLARAEPFVSRCRYRRHGNGPSGGPSFSVTPHMPASRPHALISRASHASRRAHAFVLPPLAPGTAELSPGART